MTAPSYVATGSLDDGTTQATPGYPSGIQAGDILLLFVSNKYPTNGPTQPSGWSTPSGNQYSGGSGASGVDTGSVYTTVFTRQADGTETGNVTVDVTSGNSVDAAILAYRPAINQYSTFDIQVVGGSDNTAGTDWSVTTGSIDLTTDDVVIAGSAVNTDAYTYTSEAIAVSGITFGTATERVDDPTTQGQDLRLVVSEHPVTAGTNTAAATYTMTASGTTTNRPAGATLLIRIREVAAAQSVRVGQQEVAALTQGPGSARVFQQEVSALTQPSGSARLFQQEISVIIGEDNSVSFETGTATFAFAAEAPTVTVGTSVVATGSADIQFSAQTPTLTGGAAQFTTGTADLTFSAQAPTVYGSTVSVTTGTASITFSAQTPTLATGVAFDTGTASITFSAQTPTVTGGNASFTTGTASLTFTAQAPTVTGGATSVTTGTASFTFAAQTPTVTANVAFDTGTASFAFNAQAPSVDVVEGLITGTASFRFIALAVEDFYDSLLTTGTASFAFTAAAPESATVTLPVLDGEVPTSQSHQGDSADETFKRRSFNS